MLGKLLVTIIRLLVENLPIFIKSKQALYTLWYLKSVKVPSFCRVYLFKNEDFNTYLMYVIKKIAS